MRGPGAPPCPACGFSSHRRCAHASPSGCDTSRRQLALAGRTCPMPCATRRASVRGRDTDARAVRPADQRAPCRWVGPMSRLLRHEHEQNLASLRSPSSCRAQPACKPPQTGKVEASGDAAAGWRAPNRLVGRKAAQRRLWSSGKGTCARSPRARWAPVAGVACGHDGGAERLGWRAARVHREVPGPRRAPLGRERGGLAQADLLVPRWFGGERWAHQCGAKMYKVHRRLEFTSQGLLRNLGRNLG